MEREPKIPNSQLEQAAENSAEQIINELHQGLESKNQEQVVTALRELGVKLHRIIGFPREPDARFDEMQKKYILQIATMTRGCRLFINTASYGQYPYQLIFPTDIPGGYKRVSEAFVKFFGGRAENKGKEEAPYWVVPLGIDVKEEDEE